MIDNDQVRNLEVEQLVAFAVFVEESNIGLFYGWANRLRPFDLELVELMVELATDARHYRDTLYETGMRVFSHELPDPRPDWYSLVQSGPVLSDDHYFVINEREANSILNAALARQQDTIELLTRVDDALRREYANQADFHTSSIGTRSKHNNLLRERIGPPTPIIRLQ